MLVLAGREGKGVLNPSIRRPRRPRGSSRLAYSEKARFGKGRDALLNQQRTLRADRPWEMRAVQVDSLCMPSASVLS